MSQARQDLRVRLEKAITIGLELPDDADPLDETLEELRALAKTAGADVIGECTQKRNAIDPSYYLGRGKAEEAGNLAQALGANIVLVDGDLTPAQLRNLEKLIKLTVVDRTELILDIFASHARTHQARVQVELAQAEYNLPRLKRLWTHLHRERGGRGFVGGAGERQIELDRRILRKAITDLKAELAEIRRRKERTLNARRELYSIALVGYTNAGKSSMMNALTDAGVKVEDALFATLDTRTRVWAVEGHFRCLLSDTVGFIRKLPHSLIETFNATLEEAISADLLLHVVDASHPLADRQIDAVHGVLRELGCERSRVVMVFNKTDRITDNSGLQSLMNMYHDAVATSAHTGEGLDALRARVTDLLRHREVEFPLRVHAGNGKLLAFLRREAEIVEESWDGDHAELTVRCEPRWLKRIEELRWNRDDALPRVTDAGHVVLEHLEDPVELVDESADGVFDASATADTGEAATADISEPTVDEASRVTDETSAVTDETSAVTDEAPAVNDEASAVTDEGHGECGSATADDDHAGMPAIDYREPITPTGAPRRRRRNPAR